jgi:phosphoribosylformimino-5-aminoimidazole carboxamide ribotide isomerase
MPPSSPIRVIPVIDLMRGQVVRAVRGERGAYRPIESPLIAGSEPGDVARALLARRAAAPAGVLYVADLDAILGGPVQREALAALLAGLPGITLWLDAGFVDPASARSLLASLGAEARRVRPVYGSESLADAASLRALAHEAEAILSLDCRLARPLDRAGCWEQPASWPGTVIVMTLDRVGAAGGPDLVTFARLRAMAPDRVWIGAGGLRGATDLAAAASAGAEGWLVATALHDGTLD